MGARDFEAGSTHGIIAATTGYATLGTAHTTACLCTGEDISGGASMFFAGLGSGGTESALPALNQPAAFTLSITVGTTNVTPGASMVPPTGVPMLIAVSKAAGTVAPTFFIHRFDTGVTTVDAAGSTVANRAPAAGTFQVGNLLDTYLWDGLIGAVGQWNRALSEGEMRALLNGRAAWLSSFGRGCVSTGAECFIDFTQPGTIRDLFNPSIAYTGGTQPAFGPATIRWPGW